MAICGSVFCALEVQFARLHLTLHVQDKIFSSLRTKMFGTISCQYFMEKLCKEIEFENSIALMRVFPKAIIVLTTKSHFHVKRTYASIPGLVVRTITSGKIRISAIEDGVFTTVYW